MFSIITYIRRSVDSLKKKLNPNESSSSPRGYVPLYVGNDRKRYLVPLRYLTSPSLKILLEESLERSQAEFGEKMIQGPICLLCDVKFFEGVIKDIEDMEKKTVGGQWLPGSPIAGLIGISAYESKRHNGLIGISAYESKRHNEEELETLLTDS